MILDLRAGIGPHHLSIGKTRKIFADGDRVDVFFSTGRGISHAIVQDGAFTVGALPLPVAWGGMAFTVDAGRVCFVHADGKRLCVSDDLATYGMLFDCGDSITAPWMNGERWSVLERGAGVWVDGELDELPLHHSCVQLFGDVTIGFGGEFPTKTELRWKRGGENWQKLAACNVNDRTTFHFGAVENNKWIYLAYLDSGLGVSLATHDGEDWYLRRHIIPIPCFAPCASFVNGELNVFACDYSGTVWRWSGADVLQQLPVEGPRISPLFAMTGYGTGGMLIPERITGDRIPVLISRIVDEATATARLDLEFVPLRTTNEAMCADPTLISQAFKRIV